MTIDEGTRLGRYEIRSQLGAGGMGEVYLAQDTKLDRKVALKILPADVAGDHNRMRRFEQEARAASALNHPNIITIHEFGEIYSTHYLVTEFIDGETLRARLRRERLKPDEALDVAQQAAFALTAAHAAGIVHRDIKPENIMLRRDGIVKVLDFGLAKLAEECRPSMIDTQADTLVRTDPGTVMGTAAYMSPEQARGLELDARTDIWSLGVVMYEMVAGRPPFKGETQSHVVVSILEHEPPLLAKFAPATPAELQRIVRKALTKDRDNRYQTVRDLMIDLRALRRDLDLQSEIERSAAPQAGTPDVIVPSTHAPIETYFRDYGAPTQAVSDAAATNDTRAQPTIGAEYLSDGISDSIINRLSQLSNLRVASLSSALRYKGQAVDPLAVGRDLKVRAVLIGWMTKRGDELSFRTELVDVRDNHRIWGEQYNNRQLADLLQVQEQISRDISEKLRLRLSGEEQQRLAKAETKNSEAYQLYLRGRYYWNKYTEEGFRKSIEYFKQAVDKDPSYALAYSGLADSYSVMGDLSYATPKEAYLPTGHSSLQTLRTVMRGSANEPKPRSFSSS